MNRSRRWLGALFLILGGCGGDVAGLDATVGDVPGGDVPALQDPDATPVGTAVGNPLTATIGSAGGTVASGDGRLEVVVPAGALSQDATITVQALSNEAPGGVGGAWRLDAGGAAFAKPVTLVFRYGAGDLAGTAAEALSLGWQGPGGAWYRLADAAVDGANGTVTATTTHFSDYAPMTGYLLFPRSAKVKVGQQQAFTIQYCKPVPGADCGDPLLCPVPLVRLSKCDPLLALPDVTWSVQGVPGGNSQYGTVAGDHLAGTYTAPGTPPVGEAAVSARFDHGGGTLTLVSPVQVFVPYEGTVTVVGPDWTFEAQVSTVPDGDSLAMELVSGKTTFTDPKLVPLNDHPDNQFEGGIVVSQDPPSLFLTLTFQRFWDCPSCSPNIPALNFLLIWHQTYDAQCEPYFVPVSDWGHLQGSITSNCKAPFAEDPLQLTLSWDLTRAAP